MFYFLAQLSIIRHYVIPAARLLERRSGRITRYFHEKAAPCQAVFLVVSTVQPDCRPTGGKISLQPFLLRKVFCSAIDTADRRPAGGAQCCRPEFSNHRFAPLLSALFVEL